MLSRFTCLLLLFISTVAYSKPILSCGFQYNSEIAELAKKYLDNFSSLEQYTPAWSFTEMNEEERAQTFESMIKKSMALESKNAVAALTTAQTRTFKVISEYKKLPILQKLVAAGFLQADFSKVYCQDSIACAGDNFTLVFNNQLLEDTFLALGPDAFEKSMRFVIGHEIGHFIQDIVYYSGGLSQVISTDETPLKSHLLTDAIGWSLLELARNDAISALILLNAHGDLEDRVSCLEQLR